MKNIMSTDGNARMESARGWTRYAFAVVILIHGCLHLFLTQEKATGPVNHSLRIETMLTTLMSHRPQRPQQGLSRPLGRDEVGEGARCD
jgi:hypothetical protein